MKRLALLLLTLALFLVPTSAHETKLPHTSPVEFSVLTSHANQSLSVLSRSSTGTFDPRTPTYKSQLEHDPVALAAYEAFETLLQYSLFELTLDLSGHGFTVNDWDSVVLPSLNAAVVAFVYDHPESQYFKISEVGGYTAFNQVTSAFFVIEHYWGGDEQKAALDTYLADFAADFDRTLPTAEQYRLIHDHVCLTATYDHMAAASGKESSAHTVYGALLQDNMAVCEGYAKAFKVLCDAVDLPCILVTGEAVQDGSFTGRSNHMWNAVCIDGDWYAVDTTWDDETTTYNVDDICITAIDYDYFLNNTPFAEGTSQQDHRASQNIYFEDGSFASLPPPELAEGIHPAAADLSPSTGSITFCSSEFYLPDHLWDITFSDGFSPASLQTVYLRTDEIPTISAAVELPTERTFICTIVDDIFQRENGFDGPVFSVSGRLDLTFPLTDPNFFTLTDSAAVNLTDSLWAEHFTMDRGTVNIFGELKCCVDYNGGTLTLNGEAIITDYHHFDFDGGSCYCGAMDSCPHTFAEIVDDYCLRSKATCTSPAVYLKSCSACGFRSKEPFSYGDPLPHEDMDYDQLCDTCAVSMIGKVGILSLTADSVTILPGWEVHAVVVCVAAYDNGRMTGLSFHSVETEPSRTFTLNHSVSGPELEAFVLTPDLYIPIYSTK